MNIKRDLCLADEISVPLDSDTPAALQFWTHLRREMTVHRRSGTTAYNPQNDFSDHSDHWHRVSTPKPLVAAKATVSESLDISPKSKQLPEIIAFSSDAQDKEIFAASLKEPQDISFESKCVTSRFFRFSRFCGRSELWRFSLIVKRSWGKPICFFFVWSKKAG